MQGAYLVRALPHSMIALISRSGEDALANISIEKIADGSLQGHVRIRSKTQGIALSLGDKSDFSRRFRDET
jgi:hypothetical protein